MSKMCKNCKELSSNECSYCPYCGNPFKKNKKNGFRVALIVITIIVLIMVGIKMGKTIEEKNRPKTYLKKYVIPSIKEIYSGYSVKGTFVTKKTCTESYNTCAGDNGSGSKEIDIYYYKVEIIDDRYPNDIISSFVYYDEDSGKVYNANLVMALSAHNIEHYLRTTNNYKNAKVIVNKVADDEYGDQNDICYYEIRNYYSISMYLNAPYKNSSNIYTIENIENALANIKSKVIKCRWGWPDNDGVKIETACAANIEYNVIFNDGYRIEKDNNTNNQKLFFDGRQVEDNNQ